MMIVCKVDRSPIPKEGSSMSDLQAVVDFILAYKWYAVLFGVAIAAVLLLRAVAGGFLKSFEEKVGKEAGD